MPREWATAVHRPWRRINENGHNVVESAPSSGQCRALDIDSRILLVHVTWDFYRVEMHFCPQDLPNCVITRGQ